MPSVTLQCVSDFYTRAYLKTSGSEILYADTNYGKNTTILTDGQDSDAFFDYIYGYFQFQPENNGKNIIKKRINKVTLKGKWIEGYVTILNDVFMNAYKFGKNVETIATDNNIGQYRGKTLFGDHCKVKKDEDGWISITLEKKIILEEDAIPFLTICPSGTIGTWSSREGGYAPCLTIEYEEIVPGNPVIYYPDSINCRNDGRTVFNWNHQATEGFGQTAYEMDWRLSGTTNWNNVKVESSNEYHEFATGTFPAGIIEWRVRTYNDCGNVSAYSTATFVSIGESEAPKVIYVKNDAFTQINWSAPSEQDIFEIEIYKNETLVYESGLQIGHDVYSYSPEIMLADGLYNLKIRMINTYGIQTQWTSYQFWISTTKPDKPKAFVNPDEQFSVRIKCMGGTEKKYVVRKNLETGEVEILGEIEGVEFVDHTPVSGIQYAYAVRAYDNGYTDSDAKVISVEFDGVVIYNSSDPSETVHLLLSEEVFMNIQMQLGKKTTYTRCIGRPYPVAENSEWFDEDIRIKCVVKKEEYEMLRRMFNEGRIIMLKTGDRIFYCDISSLEAVNTFLNKRYSIDISFKRVSVS